MSGQEDNSILNLAALQGRIEVVDHLISVKCNIDQTSEVSDMRCLVCVRCVLGLVWCLWHTVGLLDPHGRGGVQMCEMRFLVVVFGIVLAGHRHGFRRGVAAGREVECGKVETGAR